MSWHRRNFGAGGAGLLCAFLLLALPARAQTSAETNNFEAASWAFQDGAFDLAEKELAKFIRLYPHSERIPEAILLRARSALSRKQAAQAENLLTDHLASAGLLADQYQFWLAETYLQSSNYQAAAEGFAQLIRQYPDSPRLLDASYKQAWTKVRLGDLPGAVQLLSDPAKTFQTAARTRGSNPLVVDGHLLLAETLLALGNYGPAEKALDALTGKESTADAKWRLQYLRCRILLADKRYQAALENTTNLLFLAVGTGQLQFQAEAVILQARVLEEMGDYAAAISAYQQNLVEGLPEPRRRQAVLKIVELTLAQERTAEAVNKLEGFLQDRPRDPVTDLALLTLGELHLKLYLAQIQTNTPTPRASAAPPSTTTSTNDLQRAREYFVRLLEELPRSPLVGQAHLNRGWCLWIENKFAESQSAFKLAAEQLPPGYDKAVALFKFADSQFRQGDHTNALKGFRALIGDFAETPSVETNLFGHAYYQILRASLEIGDLPAATDAMQQILENYPDSAFRDPGILIVGQAVSDSGNQTLARAIYEQFIERFPDSQLMPQVSLALARSYFQEQNWPAALHQFEQWLARFPTNPLRPEASYHLAWAMDKSGRDTNALTLFTNFVAEFPTNQFNPLARFWIGDFYFRHKDYRNAQATYQRLAESFPGLTPLSYQARMMAGLAAVSLGFYADAAGRNGHFNALINDRSCPPELVAQAFFALGDTILKRDAETRATKLKFVEAIEAFSKIPELADLSPTNRLIPLALGQIGNCHLQLAEQDAQHYDLATNAYQRVLKSPYAEMPARNQATVGIGVVLEKLAQNKTGVEKAALLSAAREQYLSVVYGKSDAFWLKEAGLSAARIAEEQNDWQVAASVYRRLLTQLPPLQASLERRLQKAQEQARFYR